jgi:lysophospholipase L1-like esterase
MSSLLGWSKVASGLLVLAGLSMACSDDASPPPPPPASTGAAGLAGSTVGGAGVSGAGGLLGGAGSSAGTGVGGVGGVGGVAGVAGVAGAATAGAAGMSGGATSGGSGTGGTNGGSGPGGGTGGGAVQLADWQFYGRWDLTQAGKAVTVNSGSHVTASFMGAGITAKFDTSGNASNNMPTVSIKIDDGALVEKEISATLELAAGLPVALHTVTLFVRGMNEGQPRWTAPLVSSTVFLGFTVAGGNIVPSPRPTRLKMEFLGDSITEGVALHATGPQGQTSASWRTDGPRGFAALTAQKLQAEWRQVGFGRQGLTIVGNGGVPKAQDAFNWFYAGVPRDAWQPDVVVLNQGTNDRGATGATFAPLYGSFLGLIRAAYPNAKLVAVRPFVGAFGEEIKAQVAARQAAGDAKVFYLDTAGWTQNADFSDGLHPNQAGSVKIADKLATALQALPN